MDPFIKKAYLAILKEELVPAMGCTEPIALAYAAARVREILGRKPEQILVLCSGNMIKNVRCVQIPHSGGMHGIEAATVLGAFGGEAAREMEVLEAVTEEDIREAEAFIREGRCRVEFLDSEIPLHFIVKAQCGEEDVSAEVRWSHMNIVRMTKNGKILEDHTAQDEAEELTDRSCLSIEQIKLFADEIEIAAIKELIDRQISFNMEIAYEGMAGGYGLGIGKVLRGSYADDVVTRMKAYAAAASEARMDGCDLPVIINSGSGNQGIASSVPVIIYAREKNLSREKLYRALVFAALLTTYQKEFIGKLSAFCGAVSASCASGAAITYLCGGSLEQITATIDNTLANIPGIICDGAKISCASKIATCLDAAMMAHFLAMSGGAYEAYTGILKEEAGETISCVGRIGKYGMKETDKEIVRLMLQK